MKRAAAPRTLARRLLPLQIGMALQGLILWVPIEKLFMTQIGFDAASVGAMAAAYAAVVPLLEVPSGILADRWSRSRLMVLACVALMVSSLLGGLSQSVIAYVIAAMILGVYFAFSSGTVDSIVYDAVVEETGSNELYERWIGRIRAVESAAFVLSALAGECSRNTPRHASPISPPSRSSGWRSSASYASTSRGCTSPPSPKPYAATSP